jgi:23S rRNA pseudouridine2605 synthase
VVDLTLREGRNREVRRLMKALGIRLDALRRTAFGPIELGRLQPGRWRDLSAAEIRSLRKLAKRRER